MNLENLSGLQLMAEDEETSANYVNKKVEELHLSDLLLA